MTLRNVRDFSFLSGRNIRICEDVRDFQIVLSDSFSAVQTKRLQPQVKDVTLVGVMHSNEIDDFFLECTMIYFFYFISIFILLTRRKATEALIHRISNYPDLLLEIPRYCCPLVI